MRKSNIDVPVALIFFNRPEQFAQVFETVKKAAPSKLFLIQDGARENNENDVKNIQKCREVLKGIDWDCEVHTDFSEENLGCGKRIFTGLSNCFAYVDRLIILEDDCLPAQSFFPFCAEILERYKDDARVGMITGMNHLNTFEPVESDYFFANVGSIAGWATWKRSWELVSFDLNTVAEDATAMRLLKNYQKYAPNRNTAYDNVLNKAKVLNNGGKLSSWSTQFGISQILQSKLIVIPRVNLMTNIGLTTEAANSPSSIKLIPHALRPLYRLNLYALDFPLKHPKYVVNDIEYCRKVDHLMRPNKAGKMCRRIESVFLRLIHGDSKNLIKSLKRKLKIG